MESAPKIRRPKAAAWTVAAALAGGVFGLVGVASAQDASTSSTPAAATTTASGSTASSAPAKGDAARAASTETALTGDTAAKVSAAAVAAVPGATVDRTETDDDGSPYEAHITKADGTKAIVKVDANFAVTSVEDQAARGGKGGPGGGKGGAGETPLTGDTATKVAAAATAAVPGGTVDRTETDNDGSPYEAHVTKADGTKVTVKVDANFAVTSVDAN